MKKIGIVVVIAAFVSLFYLNRKESPIFGENVFKSTELEDVKTQSKRIVEQTVKIENKELIEKIVDPKGGDIRKEYRDEALTLEDIRDVEVVINDLSRCIKSDSCKDSKSFDRYYDPNEGTYHRALSKSLDLLTEQINDGLYTVENKEGIKRALKIKNARVQLSAALLISSLNDDELITSLYESCDSIVDNSLSSVLHLLSSAELMNSKKRKDIRDECIVKSVKQGQSNRKIASINFAIKQDIGKDKALELSKTLCPLKKSESEVQKRVYVKFMAVMDKYNISCRN
ncbi:hypothetical protein HBN50_06945 [Halobacteriovorax sp. GB3]|uniref:hypothetical protein n=1 Tax=Halobacteriovorax sp. GB3 TaxID=2719615 RepID=UPI0023624252|nr:hypothetical protein [Halobacteriovorax sp. GB3]MDD0852824.1 hypothetical protein [Halobacteriovorax sp. GB3]